MKKGPIIFISLLVLIVIFIIGMQYGKRVEQTNETIAVILSTTPSPSPPVVPTTPITFQSYGHEDCGLSFLYPSTLEITKESSQEATLAHPDTSEHITVSCRSAYTLPVSDDMASASAELGGRTITVYRSAEQVAFTMPQPYSGNAVHVTISEHLFALFQGTLEFMR